MIYIKGTIFEKKNYFYQIRYNPEDSELDPLNKNPKNYDIQHISIIKEKLLTFVVDVTTPIDRNSEFKIISQQILIVDLEVNNITIHPRVVITKCKSKEFGAITYIECGPRFMTHFAFRAEIKSHNDNKIKKIVTKKLSDRGFKVLLIKDLKK